MAIKGLFGFEDNYFRKKVPLVQYVQYSSMKNPGQRHVARPASISDIKIIS
jgi:hypothetical protein